MQSNDTQTLKVSTLWVVSLCVFMFPFMVSSVNIALPAIQADFDANAVLLSWIATAYLLASGVMLVPAGKLGDIYGRKKNFYHRYRRIYRFYSGHSLCLLYLLDNCLSCIPGCGGGNVNGDKYGDYIRCFSCKGKGKSNGYCCGVCLYRVFIWPLCRWMADRLAGMEEHISCQCTHRNFGALSCHCKNQERVGRCPK